MTLTAGFTLLYASWASCASRDYLELQQCTCSLKMESRLVDLQTFLSSNLLLICLVLIAVFIIWVGIAPFLLFKRLGVPGPTPLPFIGNLIDFIKKKEEFLLHEYYVKKYGHICGYYLGVQPMLLISDPEIIKQITIKEFSKFVNRPLAGSARRVPPTDKGLLASFDDDWRRLRTTITPVFSAAKMKQVVPLINSSCSTLAKVFGKAAESQKSIDVFRTYGKFTMEVIMSTAFGLESNSQTNKDDVFTSNAQEVFKIRLTSRLEFIFPFLAPLSRLYFGLGGGKETKAAKSVQFIVETARRIIKQRQEEGSSSRKDLLELMLSAEMKDEQGNKVQKLSEDETVAQCFTFILAGYETTSNALAYTSYLLALNPDKQEKLFEEIDSVYDGKGEITYELVQSLEYMDMVINESLRLYPPAFRYGRSCNEDCTINGIRFQKGMRVLFPVYAMQRDPEYWPDPLRFEPERFTGEAKEQRHPFCFTPFGMGPRQCIGMRFALIEAKMALTYLVKEYRLEQCPETEVPLDTKGGITMSPRNGIFLRFSKRN